MASNTTTFQTILLWVCMSRFSPFFPRLLRLSYRRPHVPQSRGHLPPLLCFSSNASRTYLILSYLILSYLLLSHHHSKMKAKLVSLEEPYLLGQRTGLATGKPHPIHIGDLGIHHEITTLQWPYQHHPTTQGTIHGAPLPLPKVPIHLHLQRLQTRIGRTGDRWCLVRAFGPGLRM